MSVMSDMLGDMLKKALPPEVMEMLTPEKIKEFGDKCNAFLVDHKDQMQRIEDKLDAIGKVLENGRCNDSDATGTGSPAKRNARGSSGTSAE